MTKQMKHCAKYLKGATNIEPSILWVPSRKPTAGNDAAQVDKYRWFRRVRAIDAYKKHPQIAYWDWDNIAWRYENDKERN